MPRELPDFVDDQERYYAALDTQNRYFDKFPNPLNWPDEISDGFQPIFEIVTAHERTHDGILVGKVIDHEVTARMATIKLSITSKDERVPREVELHAFEPLHGISMFKKIDESKTGDTMSFHVEIQAHSVRIKKSKFVVFLNKIFG